MYKSYGKRVVDVLGAIFALSVLAIPMLIVAIAIKLTSKGTVFYTQDRIGKDSKLFKIYKFRTLKQNMCFDGYQANSDATAKSSIGNFLRVYSIDELPQLFNVLNGTMSLIGPRPHPVYLDTKFGTYSIVAQRYQVCPGITGLAQVHGLRGETKTLDQFTSRILLDIKYIEQLSFFNDVKIVLQTLGGIFTNNKGS